MRALRLFTLMVLASALVPTIPAATADPATSGGLVDPQTPIAAHRQMDGSMDAPTWQLVFSDEFNDGTIDSSKWQTVYRDLGRQTGPTGATIRRFWRHANVWENNGGSLTLQFNHDEPCSEETNPDIPCYSGSRLDSDGKFTLKYGWLQARIHITWPHGKQSAFWMMPPNGTWPGGLCDGTANDGAEIDIVEANKQINEYRTNTIWDGYQECRQESWQQVPVCCLHDNYWNTFSLVWTPTKLEYYLNGVLRRTITDPDRISDVQQFPILSGGVFAPGVHVDGDIRTAVLPDPMYVDWIRVYQMV